MDWEPNRFLGIAMMEYLNPPVPGSRELRIKYGLRGPFAVQPVFGTTTRFY